MKNQYNSDKIWQDKLGNHAMKTPMHLFDRIDQKRTFSYKVRNQIRLHRSKFVVGLLLLFLMCGGATYWMMNDFSQVASDEGLVINNLGQVASDGGQEIKPRETTTLKTGRITDFMDSKISQNKTTTKQYSTAPLKETTALTTGGITDFMDSKISQSKTTKQQHSTTPIKETTALTTGGITDSKISRNEDNNTTVQKYNSTTIQQYYNTTTTPKETTVQQPNNTTALKETTAQQHNNTTALKETTIITTLPTEELSINLAETTSTPDNGCTNFNQRPKTKFTVDVLAWRNYNDKKFGLQNNATVESNDYVTQRENTETSRYGVGGGVRLSIDLPIEISLRTGLYYNQIHERFDLADTNASRTIIYIDNLTGISDTINETGTRIMETYNYYRMLDIPVMVGYTFKKGNMYAGINGGVLFNILLKQKGHILKADNEPTLITNHSGEEGETYFKNNIGLQLYGSVEFGYKVNDRIDFLIEPHVKHMLSSITQYNHPLSQKYTTYGLAGGLRFKF